MNVPSFFHFPVLDYDLEATLSSGQVFRWQRAPAGWEGVVNGRWVILQQAAGGLRATCAEPVEDWRWLGHYLQVEVNLAEVLAAFPADDAHLQEAVRACRGLRLLRQDPWECLASFILSSTKQIVHIRQIIECLCARYGWPVAVPEGHAPARAFPDAATLAGLTEAALRACRMGFRARYLREAARRVAEGELDLAALGKQEERMAREALMALPGVGPKIADCVLLFAYGFPRAFPVDVWVRRALHTVYFPRQRLTLRRLEAFIRAHFGPQAGYAQQYLFHYWRSRRGRGQKPSLTRGKAGL